MEDLIAILQYGTDLRDKQVNHAVKILLSDEELDGEKAEFLKALHKKRESAAELAAFAKALLLHAVNPEIDPAKLAGPLLDVCGTGGDKLEIFNVSTTNMFVLAAGGACVVKHGNRAITSKCGGADVLEQLGIKIELTPEQLRACLEQHSCGFIFAPAYHPAFKIIAPVRKALALQGHTTIFNLLGPLLNPARPAHQLVGVFSEDHVEKYAAALSSLGRKHAWVVNGNGMDEISLAGPTTVCEVKDGVVKNFTIDPATLGLQTCTVQDLHGGDKVQNAQILTAILDGSERGPKRDIVVLNAAAGFVVSGLAADIPAGIAKAVEVIDSGKALAKLNALQSF